MHLSFLKILAVFLFSVTIYAANSSEDFYTCKKSQDCVITQADSCDCGSSGTNTAINKAKMKEWTQKIEKEGEDSACLSALSDDWTCTKKVKAECLKNKCTIVEAK